MHTLDEMAGTIANSAYRIASQRWQTITAFFGSTRLRERHTFPPIAMAREPLAPGFKPVDGTEFLASTFVEIDVSVANTHSYQQFVAESEAMLDAAAWRLETQVRESMRGRAARGTTPAVPPAIVLEPGDRIWGALLAGGAPDCPIRFRIQVIPGTTRARVDLELLLVKSTGYECASGAAKRLIPTVNSVVSAALSATSHDGKPMRVLIDCGIVDGYPTTVLVGMGQFAAERVRQAGELIVEELPPYETGDGQQPGGS